MRLFPLHARELLTEGSQGCSTGFSSSLPAVRERSLKWGRARPGHGWCWKIRKEVPHFPVVLGSYYLCSDIFKNELPNTFGNNFMVHFVKVLILMYWQNSSLGSCICLGQLHLHNSATDIFQCAGRILNTRCWPQLKKQPSSLLLLNGIVIFTPTRVKSGWLGCSGLITKSAHFAEYFYILQDNRVAEMCAASQWHE